MSSAANKVTGPALLEVTKTLFRPADSPKLRAMLSKLAIYSDSDRRFELASDPEGNVSTRAVITKSKELATNGQRLMQINLDGETLFERLIARVPVLSESLHVTADHTNHHVNRSGEHFISLRFDGETGQSVKEERAKVWNALEEMADSGQLEWSPYEPELQIAHMGIWPYRVPRRFLQPVRDDIEQMLPIPVTLSPLRDPAHT